jgi:predicted RNase H-like HicB family nuclease
MIGAIAMPHRENYTVRIEVLENGFTVSIPDMAERQKRYAEAKKNKTSSTPYMGDATKSFAAKTTAEVMKYVKSALEQIPETEYESAFKEATK